MRQRRRYKNPPIEEAICEFRFKPGPDWDLTIPGKLQAKLGDEYTGKPRERRRVEVGIEAQLGKPSNLRYGEELAMVQLVTKDGKRMVGVGSDILSVSMLRPYHDVSRPGGSGWDEFKPRIADALDAYRSVAEPVGVFRIGIRYINKIAILQNEIRVENYLKCALPDVDGLPDRLNNFISRVEYVYEDGVRLVLSQGLIQAPSDDFGFLLDLDVIWENATPIVLDDALSRVKDLRNRERDAFETVITDEARKLFDAS